MNAPFASFLKLEMFHGIGNVNARSIDASIYQRTVKQAAGGADEWPARQVFLVARLLADQHQVRGGRPLAEDRLRGVQIKLTSLAGLGSTTQQRECGMFRQKVICAWQFRRHASSRCNLQADSIPQQRLA
jgi:hypothetical protein